jgi:hypothetical protein
MPSSGVFGEVPTEVWLEWDEPPLYQLVAERGDEGGRYLGVIVGVETCGQSFSQRIVTEPIYGDLVLDIAGEIAADPLIEQPGDVVVGKVPSGPPKGGGHDRP